MILGLERRYGGGGEIDPVYLEAGPKAIEGLTAVGRQPVEVVSRVELKTRYTGKQVAPALTIVSVVKEHGLLGIRYSVTLSSFAIHVRGAIAWPRGGAHIFHFRQWGGLLWADGEDRIVE